MKWIGYLLLAVLVGGGWVLYSGSGKELAEIEKKIGLIESSEDGEDEEALPKLESEKQTIEGEKMFNGILLAFLSAGLVGVLFVFQVLPALANRFTHAVYDSAEMVEKDPMHDARSLVAQGDYEGAIAAFREAAALDPLNRLPWVEIAKIQKDNMEQPFAAIQTIRYALESQEWQVNDAAYFLFRLAELYDEHMSDRASAGAILQQVIDQFPETRHSANARHKLHEWGLA
jgi:tetratricopeptide (TPR) repeat protein